MGERKLRGWRNVMNMGMDFHKDSRLFGTKFEGLYVRAKINTEMVSY